MVDAVKEISEEQWARGGKQSPTSLVGEFDITGCRCRMHKVSQKGVPEGVGCWRKPIGKHHAVRAVENGVSGFCHAEEFVRRADVEFEKMCREVPVDARSYACASGYEPALRFATGVSDIKAFSRGYCHLSGFRQGFFSRVARVMGPNPFVMDVLKGLCIGGRSSMKRLKVEKVAEGSYHVSVDKSVKGVDPEGGKLFYARLVEIAKEDPEARIGAGVATVRTLQFGDAEPLIFFEASYPTRTELFRAALAEVMDEFKEEEECGELDQWLKKVRSASADVESVLSSCDMSVGETDCLESVVSGGSSGLADFGSFEKKKRYESWADEVELALQKESPVVEMTGLSFGSRTSVPEDVVERLELQVEVSVPEVAEKLVKQIEGSVSEDTVGGATVVGGEKVLVSSDCSEVRDKGVELEASEEREGDFQEMSEERGPNWARNVERRAWRKQIKKEAREWRSRVLGAPLAPRAMR